jgi:hypothetical protein
VLDGIETLVKWKVAPVTTRSTRMSALVTVVDVIVSDDAKVSFESRM